MTLEDGTATEHMTCDLSAGGVRLCGRPLARVGEEVELLLHLPQSPVRTAGRILRLAGADGRSSFAVQFADLTPHAEDAIHDAVVEALSLPGRRSVMLFQDRHDPRWPGWEWLRPLYPICTLATTPLEAVRCLQDCAIEISILDTGGRTPPPTAWSRAVPELPWRTIDRSGRLHSYGSDPRLPPRVSP